MHVDTAENRQQREEYRCGRISGMERIVCTFLLVGCSVVDYERRARGALAPKARFWLPVFVPVTGLKCEMVTLVVTKLDRLGRNTGDVLATVDRLASIGVHVHCLALKSVADQRIREAAHDSPGCRGAVRAGLADRADTIMAGAGQGRGQETRPA